VSSLQFANDEWPPSHLILIGWIISFWAMLEPYHKLQRKQACESANVDIIYITDTNRSLM